MPRKPKRPCAYPGCPALTDGKYCAEHAPLAEKARLEGQHRYNRYKRDPEIIKQYGTRWKKIRKAYAEAHPLCESCLRRGLLVPLDEVHHIIAVKDGGTHSFDNLMSLCHSCHEKLEESRRSRKG